MVAAKSSIHTIHNKFVNTTVNNKFIENQQLTKVEVEDMLESKNSWKHDATTI